MSDFYLLWCAASGGIVGTITIQISIPVFIISVLAISVFNAFVFPKILKKLGWW